MLSVSTETFKLLETVRTLGTQNISATRALCTILYIVYSASGGDNTMQ